MTEVVKVNETTKKKMLDFYRLDIRPKTPPYAIFQAEQAGTVITLYQSGKAVFQGPNAKEDAMMWNSMGATVIEKKEKPKEVKEDNNKDYYFISSVGSDEVGTGDYFGPIVVTAAYVSREDVDFLMELGIKDSKKLTDQKIMEIVPKFINKIEHESRIMTAEKYNQMHGKNNMNKIKALMHNEALYNLVLKNDLEYDYIIVDQFVNERKYFEYLKGYEKVLRNLTFMTKAEDKNPAVAAASLISRYLFVKEFDKLSDSVNYPLPKGAGTLVDNAGRDLVRDNGIEILDKIAKVSFKNTNKILDK